MFRKLLLAFMQADCTVLIIVVLLWFFKRERPSPSSSMFVYPCLNYFIFNLLWPLLLQDC